MNSFEINYDKFIVILGTNDIKTILINCHEFAKQNNYDDCNINILKKFIKARNSSAQQLFDVIINLSEVEQDDNHTDIEYYTYLTKELNKYFSMNINKLYVSNMPKKYKYLIDVLFSLVNKNARKKVSFIEKEKTYFNNLCSNIQNL